MEFSPKAYRTIIFVRHGQYKHEPEKLTQLGRKQAQYAAKALATLQPTKIHCSTMPRAIETASIIGKHIGLNFKPHDMFREGLLPGTVEFHQSFSKNMSAKEKKEFFAMMKTAKANADLAFETLMTPPQRGQNIEVVVAHGNVIRYWLCKALDISTENWLKMHAAHTSFTTIRVAKSGSKMMLGFSDVGHLPVKYRSYI